VSVTDVVGHLGNSSFQPTCNDTKQTAVVFVPGNFVPGDGAARVSVCGFDCAFDSKEVHLK
jgi:hypothetical protein